MEEGFHHGCQQHLDRVPLEKELRHKKAPKVSMNKQLEFEFERATKNTYRFQEKTFTDTVIGTLYVQKALFSGKAPRKVRVTMKWE